MKVIETKYSGHLFRSRLEARWAVFFDYLNVKWEYEKEGFEFNNKIRYLPDFFLPELDCWLEVKGVYPTELEKNKAGLLAVATNKRVYIAYGQIEPPGDIWESDSIIAIDSSGACGIWSDYQYYFCECSNCGAIGIQFNGRSDRLPCKKNGCPKSPHGDKGYNFESPRLMQAYQSAMSARFE